MKKAITGLLAAFLFAGCASQTVPSESSSSGSVFSKPGTYTSVNAGRNDDVKVTVTFTENEITDIEIESKETETIGVPAMEQLKEQILAQQNLQVDTVSGATISCDAFLEGMRDTVSQAGADPDALVGKEASASAVDYVTEADIIVVGAGAAGMTAAITAADAGKHVILLEKSSTVGGNTICAANGINAADSAVQKADEKYVSAGASVEGLENLQFNNEDARENLVKAFAENSGETIDWLSSLGVEFEVDIQDDDRNSEQNYYMVKATKDGTTAVTMINAAAAELKKKENIDLYLNMDVTELVVEDGTVVGVRGTDASGNTVTFSAKSTILCTGGFGQNSKLLAEANPELANAVTDEVAPTTGEGLLMARSVGAAEVNLDAIQTFPHVIPGYGMVLPFTLPGGFTPDALYVNNKAERFTAEGFEIPDALLSQDKGEVYCIFDDSGMNDTMQNLVNSGVVSSGETAAELAEKLGIDGDALQATIDAFNDDIADGTDDAYGRSENLNSIEGTLYGYCFGVGAHYFMGGILINEKTQVLDENGSPIEGLYAAGEVTGGFHGTFRVDGSGLGDSFTFGRIAGRETSSR